MADKKISALTSLAQGDVAASTDVLPIVDTSATETKKITASALVGAGMTAGVTNVDINSGAIDGTTIGANSAAAGTFTTLTGTTKVVSPYVDAVGSAGGQLRNASGTSQLAWGAGGGSNLSLEVATNINPANAAVSIAPTGTGTVTINPATAGTMNNVAIGGSTAAAGSFTTLTTSSTVTLNGGTANGVLYLNGSKVATSGSALTFDGTNGLGFGTGGTGNTAAVLTLKGSSATNYGAAITGTRNGSGSWFIGDAGTALGSGTLGFIYYNYTTNDPWIWYDGGASAERMRLTSTSLYTASGINVGIGTSSPGAKLDVRGNATFTGNATARQTADFTNTGGQIYVGVESSAGGAVFTGSSAYAGILGTNNTTALQLATNGAVRATLDSSGNLGIGTSSPLSKLDVRAASAAIDQYQTIQAFSTDSAAIDKGAGLALGGYYSGTSSIAVFGTLVGRKENSTAGNFSGYLAFGTNNNATGTTEKMRLDSSGNLGLGVSPSAWASGYKALQVGATGALWQSTSGFTFLSDNAYVDSGAANRYITSNYATLYRQQSGQHNWFTAPSWNGTGSDAISFTQAMTLDASSNLFVGGTTGSAKLNLQTTTNSSSDSEYIRLYNAGENVGYISWINGNGDLARITGTKTGGGASANDGILTFSTATDTVLTERARITSGGYSKFSTNGTYGGGPTTSAYEFNWSDASRFQIRNNTATAANAYGIEIRYQALPNGTGNEFLYCADNDAANLRASIRSNGGIANYQANDANLSDERTKTDIRPVGSYWDKIKAIEIVAFKYKDQTHDDDNIGAIAQQVESVAPEFVDVDGWGETPEDGVPLKSIYTTDMYHAAIKALQEAMTRIEQLEAKVAALESK
jgi:hypothetical protein